MEGFLHARKDVAHRAASRGKPAMPAVPAGGESAEHTESHGAATSDARRLSWNRVQKREGRTVCETRSPIWGSCA